MTETHETPIPTITVGVLSLQGAFMEHYMMLRSLSSILPIDIEVKKVTNVDEISSLDGLVLPGGESTTTAVLANNLDLVDTLVRFADSGRPILGTCAGCIALSSIVLDSQTSPPRQGLIPCLDVCTLRNAYSGKHDSFATCIVGPVKMASNHGDSSIVTHVPEHLVVHESDESVIVKLVQKSTEDPTLFEERTCTASESHFNDFLPSTVNVQYDEPDVIKNSGLEEDQIYLYLQNKKLASSNKDKCLGDKSNTDLQKLLARSGICLEKYSPGSKSEPNDLLLNSDATLEYNDSNLNKTRRNSNSSEESNVSILTQTMNSTVKEYYAISRKHFVTDLKIPYSLERISQPYAFLHPFSAALNGSAAVFVRGPRIIALTSNKVRILGLIRLHCGSHCIAAVEQGNIIASAYHPELCGDNTLHSRFLFKAFQFKGLKSGCSRSQIHQYKANTGWNASCEFSLREAVMNV